MQVNWQLMLLVAPVGLEFIRQMVGARYTLRLFHLSSPEPWLTLFVYLAAILTVPRDKRSDEQRAAVAKFFRASDSELAQLETALAENAKLQSDPRLMGAQDLVWALINTPAFLFNR